MNVSILGTGSFGSAIAQILTDNGHKVLLWTNDLEQIEEINKYHTNKKYYDELLFDKNVKATDNLEITIKYSNILIIVLPSHLINKVTKDINKILKKLNKRIIFINMSKGIDYKKLVTISETIESNIDEQYIENIYTMSGPTFASEIIKRMITKFTLATKNIDNINDIKNIFANEYIKIEISTDIIGIEILSAVKNIIALASGIINGLGFNENTHAIIVSEGIKEMLKISLFYKIDLNTILGVSGLGDLVLTTNSTTSRNYITGKKVGSGMKINEAIKTTKTVVEGIECAKSMYKFSHEHKIELPVTNAIYNIFYKDKNPKLEILKIFE